MRYMCYMLKLSDLIIYSSESLRNALQRMTQNRRGVLFVCDEDGHLVGVLSDGDVRRSLLDNTLLISPINKVMNTDPISAPNVQEATELLHRMNIVAVPVVDNEGQICEIVVEDQDSVIVLSSEANGGGSDTVVETGVLAIIPARRPFESNTLGHHGFGGENRIRGEIYQRHLLRPSVPRQFSKNRSQRLQDSRGRKIENGGGAVRIHGYPIQ